MSCINPITPCLWFDDQAEEAARFYIDIFPNSVITRIDRFGEAGFEIHGRPAGSVMTVAFELDGTRFTALNGGPMFRFNEAISLQIDCADQPQVDYFWQRLGDGGDPDAQQCGWLKDRYGLSWQVVPVVLQQLLADPDPRKTARVTQAMLAMKKLDVAALVRAGAE